MSLLRCCVPLLLGAVGGYSMNTRHGWVRFLLDLLFPLLFIFCHFCWLQWLTGQFGDVWLFIISEGVSGLELKSFILDWFSRSLFFLSLDLYTLPVCQHSYSESWSIRLSMSTPSELLYVRWLQTTYIFFTFLLGVTDIQTHHQAFSIITILVTITFSSNSIIIILVACFALQPGKVTVSHWAYSKSSSSRPQTPLSS